MLFSIISEKYLNRQEKLGEERGRTEGHAEGRAEGLAEERERWEEWNKQRLAAEDAGEKFEEPPPPINPNGSG